MPPKAAKNTNGKNIDKNSLIGKNPDKNSSIEYPCIICNQEANEKSIRCDLCKFWCHYICADIDKETTEKYVKNKKLHWFCASCEPHAASLLDRVKVLEGNHDKMYKDTKTSIKNHTISIDQQLETLKLSIKTKEDDIYKQISEVKKSLSVPKDGTTPPFADGINLDKIKEDLTTYIDAIITAKLGDQHDSVNEATTPEVDANTKTALNARIDELQTTINNLQPKPDDVHPLPTSIETDKIREVLEEKERIDKKKCNLIFSNLEESNTWPAARF